MSHENEVDFSHSFTDLMTSLAIAFLILAVVMMVSQALAENSHAQGVENIKTELCDKLKEEFKLDCNKKDGLKNSGDCITVEDGIFHLKLKFSGDEKCKEEGLFFSLNDFRGTPNFKPVTKKLAKLYDIFCPNGIEAHYIDTVRIVGHTTGEIYHGDDSNCSGFAGLGEIQCGNLYLSSQRARQVFMMIGDSLGTTTNFGCFKKITQISGRGPFEPFDPSNTGNPKNRRVELVVNFRSPDQLEDQLTSIH